MPNTPFFALPYPADTDPNDVALYLQRLAEAVEAKVPRGRYGHATRTQQAGPVAANAGWVDVAGLSYTVTLTTPRKLRVTVNAQATSDVAGTRVGVRIRNATTGGTTGEQTVSIPYANQGEPLPTSAPLTEAAGTHTFTVQLAHFGGTGGAFLTAQPATLSVSDEGAA